MIRVIKPKPQTHGWRSHTKLEAHEERASQLPSEVSYRETEVLTGTRAGRSATELSMKLGITDRTVTRIRARLRERGDL